MADSDWVNYKPIRGEPLPAVVELLGASYRLERLLKYDFYAVVGVYDRQSTADATLQTSAPRQVLLKVYHTDPRWFPPLGALGRFLCRREAKFFKMLEGVRGIPQLLTLYGPAGLVREFTPGCNLREFSRTAVVDADFFPRLSEILAEVHARAIAHNDLSKPENILVTHDGSPALIDFQIARTLLTGPGPVWRAVSRWVIRQMQISDRYHLAKHHRRRRPLDFSAEERASMKRKGLLVTLHGWGRRPYRALRHRIMKNLLITDANTRAAEGGIGAPHAPAPSLSGGDEAGRMRDEAGAPVNREAR